MYVRCYSQRQTYIRTYIYERNPKEIIRDTYIHQVPRERPKQHRKEPSEQWQPWLIVRTSSVREFVQQEGWM
jgi:hypothetical protein